MHGVRGRNESAWPLPNDGSRTNHRLRLDKRQFADSDEIDLVIVGCGAGGSVLAQRLARAGWRVAALDAGPFWDPDTDWVSDEAGSHHLYWTDPLVIAGSDPVPMGSNNSRRGVGGSMIHYAGHTPRFHPSDFMTATLDGVGADWPLTYPSCARTTSRSSRNCRWSASTGRGETRTATRTGRTQSAGPGRSSCAVRSSSGSPPRSARSRSPTAGSGTARTASTAASACRAARSTPRPRR